jgi:hypothetical protein
MKYLCLIYEDETRFTTMPEEDMEGLMAEYRAFGDGIRKSGHYLGGHQLATTRAASTVRVRNGKMSATDGPFAETKEQLGGYFLIEAVDLNEALQIASRIPSARLGSIEVRPLHESHQQEPA